jgi:hypothetical protein
MNETYHLYLTSSRARLRRTAGWPWRRTVAEICEWDWIPGGPLAWPAATARHGARRRPLHVFAGSAFCRFMAVQLPSGLRNEDEARIVVQSQMEAELALDPGQWRYAFSGGGTLAPVVGCAMHEALCRNVQHFAESSHLRLISLRPFLEAAWNANLHPGTADKTMILVEQDAYSVSSMETRHITSASSSVHEDDAEGVRRAIRRQLIGREAPHPGALQLLQVDAQPSAAGGTPYADFRDMLTATEGWR